MKGSRLAVTGSILVVLLLLALSPGQAQEGIQAPLGGAFTFQGYLSAAGAPIEDTCDFRFGLWNAAAGGAQVGPTLDQAEVAVEQGRFTVLLDFGSVFDGTALWLETAVRCTGEPDYTTLAPRQALTAAPYALGAAWTGLYSVPAGFADDVDNDVLGGLACGGGQVAKWDGAAWSCAPDEGTAYSAGEGLVLTGTVFSADTDYLQRRAAPCGDGYAIRAINQDGTVVCALVDNTVYEAGFGLVLSDTTFLADPTVLQQRVTATCGEGSSIREVNQDGTVVCEPDDDTLYDAGFGLVLSGTTFLADPTVVQARITATCGAGSSIRQVNEDGTVVCEPDDDTLYNAGTGLILSGTTFLPDPTYLQRRVAPCGASYAIQSVNQDGSVVCQIVDNTTYDAGEGLYLAGTTFGITTTYRLPQGCSGTEIAKWNGSTWACAADNDTTYSAGTGLNLAGTTFSLLAGYQLPQSCANGEIPEWNGTAWACGADDVIDADADPTNELNTALALDGTTLVITDAGGALTSDLSTLDTLANLSCGSGQVAKWNGSAWVCAADDNTTYSAGTGLDLAGTTFSLLASYQLPQSCAGTQIARWDGAAWTCSSDVGVTDHGALSGLGDDDHPQYVHTTTARTISAVHTFDPAAAGAPFTLGANAAGQLVTGLNSDLLDGYTTGAAAGNIPVNNGALNTNLNSDLLDGLHASAFSPSAHNHWGQTWSGTGTGLTLNSTSGTGLRGGGTTYGLYGSANLTAVRADGGTHGVYADGTSTAVYGAGGTYGIWAQGTGTAVYGAGGTYGVWAQGTGTAVYGNGSTYGVFGIGSTAAVYAQGGTYGLVGHGNNYGVYGASTNTAVRADGGAYGVNATGTGTAVFANSTGPYGVWAQSSSTGVYGAGGYGVYGAGNYGMYGTGGLYGVYGTGSSAGVWGNSSATAVYGTGGTYGVYATGSSAGVRGNSAATAVYGAGGTYGVYGNGTYGVYGNGNAYGVWGNSSATAVYGTGGTYGVWGSGLYGVYGNGNAYGVYGLGNTAVYAQGGNTGVYATATNTAGFFASSGPFGVYGYTNYVSGNAFAVYGDATSSNVQNAGVYGRSTSNTGYGVAGHNYWSGVGVGAWSYGGDIYRGYSGDWPGGILRFWVDSAGNVHYDGALMPYALFPTPAGGEEVRSLYVTESPEPWSEDAGTARLVGGQAVVTIDPLYAQTLDLAVGYHVFLTPLGDCPLYVAEKTASSFTVQAMGGQKCDIAFDYRLLAKPQGTAGRRMEVLDVDLGSPSPEKTESEATP